VKNLIYWRHPIDYLGTENSTINMGKTSSWKTFPS